MGLIEHLIRNFVTLLSNTLFIAKMQGFSLFTLGISSLFDLMTLYMCHALLSVVG